MKRTIFRSDRVRPFAAAAWPALGVALLLMQGPQTAPAFERIYPVSPADGAAARERPVFTLGFDGVAPADDSRMRLKVTLDDRSTDGERYVFDQRQSDQGWLLGEPGRAVLRPVRPLKDGDYAWRVHAWDGTGWRLAAEQRRLRIDTVAPAPVEGLEATLDPDTGALELSWDPVALDLDGRPEFVVGYRVYRYDGDPSLPVVRPFQIGSTETTEFTDPDPPPGRSPILYYRVEAEDSAGNYAGRIP